VSKCVALETLDLFQVRLLPFQVPVGLGFLHSTVTPSVTVEDPSLETLAHPS
jgi:hypothetical protein